jgi:hypothetical protein
MAYRVSFFFTQQGDRLGGWSENYWNNAADYPTCLTRAQNLRPLLVTAKGDQTYCPRFRITNTSVFRSGITTIVAGAAPRVGISTGPIVPSASGSDYLVTKLLLRLYSATKNTQQWFGGQADSAIVNGGYYLPGSITNGPLFAALYNSANGWCVNTLPATQVYTPIASIDPVTGTVTLPPGAALPALNPPRLPRIRISGVRGLLYANAVWNCLLPGTPTTPPSFVLQGWAPNPQQQVPMSKSNNARYANQVFVLTQISGAAFIRSSNHRAGRPSGLVGGRQKRRATA